MMNKRNILERTVEDKLKDLIEKDENFSKKDNLLEHLFKYYRTEITLREYNNKENTEYYRKHNYFSFEKTYIWDGKGLLDNLIESWISRELIEILALYQKKKNREKIHKLILNITKEINDIIYNDF